MSYGQVIRDIMSYGQVIRDIMSYGQVIGDIMYGHSPTSYSYFYVTSMMTDST